MSQPIPDYGDVMTVEDFREQCEHGSFIDYDGIGQYANPPEMSDVEVKPSDILKGVVPNFTHVVWFNR